MAKVSKMPTYYEKPALETEADKYLELSSDEAQKPLSTKKVLNIIKAHSNNHQRKLTDSEYDRFVNILKTSFDERENFYKPYQKIAISIILKENFLKFEPKTKLPDLVDNYINEASEIPSEYLSVFYSYLENLRKPLKGQGLAYKKDMEKMKYLHPMAKYGLLKVKL